MRCISPHESYSIQVIEGKEDILRDPQGYAQRVTLREPVVAVFEKTGLLDHEQEAALMSFNFTGLPEGVNPLTTISCFDSEMYVIANFEEHERDDAQVRIDARLRQLAELFPSQFIVVDHPHAAKPWPSYDGMSVEEILRTRELLDQDGSMAEGVRLYELENEGREEIVEAMLDIEDPSRVEARAAAEPPPAKPKTKAPKDGEISVPA